MADDVQAVLREIADLKRRVANVVRLGSVHEVKSGGNERKMRVNMGNDPDGKPILSPWLHSAGGDGKSHAREEKLFSKGQNVLLISPDGDFRQAHVFAGAENDAHPRPDHASDDAETYQYDQLRVTKKGDAYEVWLAEGSSQQQGQSQQGQGQQGQGQDGQRSAGTAAVKVRIHKDGGITARVGKDGEAVRFSAHKEGAKLKYKNDHWLVVTKDGLIVSKAPEVGKDPILDDNQ
jgi:phage baseplate assembly protein gpV